MRLPAAGSIVGRFPQRKNEVTRCTWPDAAGHEPQTQRRTRRRYPSPDDNVALRPRALPVSAGTTGVQQRKRLADPHWRQANAACSNSFTKVPAVTVADWRSRQFNSDRSKATPESGARDAGATLDGAAVDGADIAKRATQNCGDWAQFAAQSASAETRAHNGVRRSSLLSYRDEPRRNCSEHDARREQHGENIPRGPGGAFHASGKRFDASVRKWRRRVHLSDPFNRQTRPRKSRRCKAFSEESGNPRGTDPPSASRFGGRRLVEWEWRLNWYVVNSVSISVRAQAAPALAVNPIAPNQPHSSVTTGYVTGRPARFGCRAGCRQVSSNPC
jgi:hypothetical protein